MLDNPRNEFCETIELRNRVVPTIVNPGSDKNVWRKKYKSEIQREVKDEREVVDER